MNERRPPAPLGVLVAALAALRPGAAELPLFAEAFGLGPAASPPRVPPARPPRRPSTRSGRPRPVEQQAPPSPPSRPVAADEDGVRTRLYPLQERSGAELPPALRRAAPLPLGRPGPGDAAAPPPAEPLLPRRTARGVLVALLSRRAAVGRLDLPRLADLVARGGRVERLPRLPAFAPPREAVVVVDLGPGLEPFRDDTLALLAALRGGLGTQRVGVARCAGWPPALVPQDAVEPFGTEEAYDAMRPPRTGVPVLLLTDLGLTDLAESPPRAGAAEWGRFAGRLRAAGCRVLALAPVAEGDLRAEPAMRHVPALSWTEAATARGARRLAERAWRR